MTWAIAAAAMIAVLNFPQGYYQFLRLLVTGYGGYVAFLYFRSRPQRVAWLFAFIALLHNPVFVISMSEAFHGAVNIATGIVILMEFYHWRRNDPAAPEGQPARQGMQGAANDSPRVLGTGEGLGGQFTRLLFDVATGATTTVVALALVFYAVDYAHKHGFELPGLMAGDEVETVEPEVPGSTAVTFVGEPWGNTTKHLDYFRGDRDELPGPPVWQEPVVPQEPCPAEISSIPTKLPTPARQADPC